MLTLYYLVLDLFVFLFHKISLISVELLSHILLDRKFSFDSTLNIIWTPKLFRWLTPPSFILGRGPTTCSTSLIADFFHTSSVRFVNYEDILQPNESDHYNVLVVSLCQHHLRSSSCFWRAVSFLTLCALQQQSHPDMCLLVGKLRQDCVWVLPRSQTISENKTSLAIEEDG